MPAHTSSVPAYGMYGLPLPFRGLIFLILLVPVFFILRRSAGLRSKLKRLPPPPSSSGSQLPPEVRAVYAEAKARATALPADAQAIALD